MSSYLYHIMLNNDSNKITRNLQSLEEAADLIIPLINDSTILEKGVRVIKTQIVFEDMFNNGDYVEHNDVFNGHPDVVNEVITKAKEIIRENRKAIFDLNK